MSNPNLKSMSEAQKRQDQIDRINKRLGTSPEFAMKVHDYFSKPVVAVQKETKIIKEINDGSTGTQEGGVTR